MIEKITQRTKEALAWVPSDWTPCAWPKWVSCRSVDALKRKGLIEDRRYRGQWFYRRTKAGDEMLIPRARLPQ